MARGFTMVKFRRYALYLALGWMACLSLTGCATFEQRSDFRWKRWNPEYRPLEPVDAGQSVGAGFNVF
jgi:hypothetical protein